MYHKKNLMKNMQTYTETHILNIRILKRIFLS